MHVARMQEVRNLNETRVSKPERNLIPVAALYVTLNSFTHLNTWIVNWNPTRDKNVYLFP
jgi:hypothetical protein